MKKSNDNLSFYLFTGALTLFLFFIFSPNTFASTDITNNILFDTTWTIDNSPYVIRNSINVLKGSVLTIDPGVVVKFDPSSDVSLNIFGDIVINGEESNKVYFTSYYDDTVGGDTNEDSYCDEDFDDDGNKIGETCGSLFEPLQNDWQGINFLDSHSNFIKNAVFKYADMVAYLDHTYLNLKNVEITDGNLGIMQNVSNIDADVLNCTNLSDSCFMIFNSSSVNLGNSLIDNIANDGIDVFHESILNIKDTTIKNITGNFHPAILVYRNSTVTGDDLDFSHGSKDGDFVSVYNHSNFNLENSKMTNCPEYACIEVYDTFPYVSQPSSLDVDHSIFSGGVQDAISIFGDSVIIAEIHNSKIIDFPNFSINTYPNIPKNINAENNFWGNSSGPFHPDKNPTGTAGIVSNYVDFIPFCENELCKTRDPVILIPGIMGTEIKKDYGEFGELWPNISKLILSVSDNFLDDLALLPSGIDDPERPMKLGDIIRSVKVDMLGKSFNSDTFGGLISELNKAGYKEGKDLFVFPYDWRKSNADSAQKLKDKIDAVLAETGAAKVDLVAHSMGGLVAKKYIADNGGDKVDQLIFIATPHIGAPKAFKALMYGDDMGINIKDVSPFRFLNPDKVKFISQNMPGVFELLPSKKYVDDLGRKYVNDMATPRPIVLLGTPYLSYDETKNFMLKNGRNSKMFPIAESLHESIDNLDLSGINTADFTGCGTTKTITDITLKKKKSWTTLWTKLVDTFQIGYGNGDDTVPIVSASNGKYNKKYYVKGYSHSTLPSASGLKETLVSLLKGEAPANFPNVSNTMLSCDIDGVVISLQSFLELEKNVLPVIYDQLGNRTGPLENINSSGEDTDTNNVPIENNIPGVQYDRIGGATFVFLPRGGSYQFISTTVNTDGTLGGGGGVSAGSYDISIGNINGNDEKIKEIEFNNIPSDTGNEVIKIDIPETSFPDESGNIVNPIVKVDEDGDGDFEKEILPDVTLDHEKASDIIAPETQSEVSGNVVTLLPIDGNSGILETDYSLDGGVTWKKNENPITITSTPGGSDIVVQYFSTDKAGNVEQIKEIIIKATSVPSAIPIVENNIPIRHSAGGGILLTSDSQRSVLNEAKGQSLLVLPKLNSEGGANLNLPEGTILKGVQDMPITESETLVRGPFLNKKVTLNKLETKNIAKNQNKNLDTSQTASAINSTENIKLILVLITVFGIILVVLIARRREQK